eukprot:g7351.t1
MSYLSLYPSPTVTGYGLNPATSPRFAEEKQKYQEWLAQTIQALKDQLDQFEADTQLLSGKKAPSADDKSRLPKLQKAQERTRWHIKKLEQLLRAANNDAVEVSDLAIFITTSSFTIASTSQNMRRKHCRKGSNF